MLNDFILIGLLLLAYWYWSNGQQVKELALRAVRARCLSLELQMLDEYVALSRVRFKRDSAGKIRLLRIFSFEFSSTGNERYNGICIMLGQRLESIQVEPYRFEE